MDPKSLRILLINDTPGKTPRQMVLEEHGHKVALVTRVQEGLDLLTSQTFDLVVMSGSRMPNSARQEVIKEIRRHAPQILILVPSGDVESLGLTQESTGADVVLSKGPHEIQDLLRAIDRLSRRRIPTKPPGSVRKGSQSTKGKAS